jgi:hypothetical protein
MMDAMKRTIRTAAMAALASIVWTAGPAHAATGVAQTLVDAGPLAELSRALADVPTYGWFGLLAVSIIGSCAYLGATLNQLRKEQRRAFEANDKREFEMLAKAREKDAGEVLNNEEGWRLVIAQVAADVTATGVVVDDAGILNATIHPTPYFTVRAADGREFYFTVDPDKLRETRVVPSKARAISVSQHGSLTAAVDLQLIWHKLTQQRRMAEVVLPRHANWYCIVKNPELAAIGAGRMTAAYGKR